MANRHFLLCTVTIGTIGMLLVNPAVGAGSQETPAETESVCQLELVEQLGADSYKARAEAARRLRELGAAARPALQAALRSGDLEVRLRAAALLKRAEQDALERRIESFLADAGGSQSFDLPGWTTMQEVVGDSLAARRLYVEMMRTEGELLASLEADREMAAQQLAQRVRWYQDRSRQIQFRESPLTPAATAVLLLASADPGLQQASSGNSQSIVQSQLYSLLNFQRARDSIFQDGQQSAMLRQLMQHWIRSTTTSQNAYYGVMLSLNYNFEEAGRDVSRRLLTERDGLSSSLIPYAAMALARFGDQQDIPLLEGYLEFESVCHTWSNRQVRQEPIRIQVRDVVLAMLVHMSGQDLDDYGFQFASPHDSTVYSIYTLGFLEDEDRQEALQRWKAWRAEQELQEAGKEP